MWNLAQGRVGGRLRWRATSTCRAAATSTVVTRDAIRAGLRTCRYLVRTADEKMAPAVGSRGRRRRRLRCGARRSKRCSEERKATRSSYETIHRRSSSSKGIEQRLAACGGLKAVELTKGPGCIHSWASPFLGIWHRKAPESWREVMSEQQHVAHLV